MPISPENRKRYPANWKAISERIRTERAKNRCECTGDCGINHSVEDGITGPNAPITQAAKDISSGRCIARNGRPHPITKSIVVLTVAHLDHTPENCGDDNLKAMCQRCHNRYDAPHRKKNAARTRRLNSPQTDLFDAAKELA